MIKTVVDKNSGKVLFCTDVEVEILENQVLIEIQPIGDFANPYWSFENKEFFDSPNEE